MEQFTVCNLYSSQMDDGYADGYATISTNSCKLLGLIAENISSSTRYVQIYDGYELPDDDSIPLISYKLLAATQTERDFTNIKGLDLQEGCIIAVSSTGTKLTTVTGSATDGCFISAFWR